MKKSLGLDIKKFGFPFNIVTNRNGVEREKRVACELM